MSLLKTRRFLNFIPILKLNNRLLCVNKSVVRNSEINTCVSLTTCTNRYRINSRFYTVSSDDGVSSVAFEKVCEETLESLCEYFEELIESTPHLQAADVTYGAGVLTVNFGGKFGTYVINRQSPNKQIWLSSPVSGPKRYDFVPNENYWIYKHDNKSLHELLQQEMKTIVQKDTDFAKCAYSFITK